MNKLLYILIIVFLPFQIIAQDTEDFETGDFSSFSWSLSGDVNWSIVSDEQNGGTYSAKSGAITDSQDSNLGITIDCDAGNITFYRKVSSESGYDYLKFYIDGSLEDSWSGGVAWAQETYAVSAGSHAFKWVYSKDGNVSSGSDCAWVDDIVFPVACTTPGDPSNPTATSNSCGSQTLTKPAGEAGTVTYYWQGTNASGTSTANSSNTYEASATGTYYIRAYEATGGCWSTGSGSVAVTVNDRPSAPGNPSTTTDCANEQTLSIADGSGADTWYWQGQNSSGTSTSNNATSDYTVNAGTGGSGTYYVRAQASNGCWSSSSGSVSVSIGTDTPTGPNGEITGNTTPCVNGEGYQYSMMNITDADNFVWTVPAGASIVGDDTGWQITVNFGSSTGDITCTPRNGVCSGDTYTLTISSFIPCGEARGLSVSGNWTNEGTFEHGNGTVVFGGTSDQTFTAGGSAFYNLFVDKTAGVAEPMESFTVENDLYINDGTLEVEVKETNSSATALPSTGHSMNESNSCLDINDLGTSPAAGEYSEISITVPAEYADMNLFGIEISMDNGASNPNDDFIIYALAPGETFARILWSGYNNGNGNYGFDRVKYSDYGVPVAYYSDASPMTGHYTPGGTLCDMDFSTVDPINGTWKIYVVNTVASDASAYDVTSASIVFSVDTIELGKDWHNDDTFTCGATTLLLTGSNNTSIKGNTETEFYKVTVNKSSSDNEVILEQNTDVSGYLTFESGKVDLNGNDLDLKTTGSLVDETESNRVYDGTGGGSIITSDYIMSSNSHTYSNIKGLGLTIITQAAGNVPGTTDITRKHTIVENIDGSGGGSIKRTFDISPTTNTSLGATLRLGYFDAELDAQTEADMHVYRNDGGGWVDYDSDLSNTTVNTSSNYIQVTGVSAFSEWGGGSGEEPLPVDLISFNALCLGEKGVQLTWTTASEINNDYFLIKRSVNGYNWEDVASVTGTGNSSELNSYEYLDNFSAEIPVYYRIKQVDYNGDFELFNTVSVNCQEDNLDFEVSLYPNPNKGKFNVQINAGQEEGVVQLELLNPLSQTILYKQLNYSPGNNVYPINTKELSPGVYVLQILSSKKESLFVEKVIIK